MPDSSLSGTSNVDGNPAPSRGVKLPHGDFTSFRAPRHPAGIGKRKGDYSRGAHRQGGDKLTVRFEGKDSGKATITGTRAA